MKLGIYQHYKGKWYQVISVAKHTETLEDLVIYKPLYPSKTKLWVRPKKMFLEQVKLDEKLIARFKYIKK